MDKPEALRLADWLDELANVMDMGRMPDPTDYRRKAGDVLRRLRAENASLAAALASSCDEQRRQLWESGGIAGCERARAAERQRDALLEALKNIDKEFKAHGRQHWPEAVKAKAAIAAVEGEKT